MPQKKNFMWIKRVLGWLYIAISCLIINSASYATSSLEGIQIYSQNSLSTDKKQVMTHALIRYQSADNLWYILRTEFSLPHYERHPAVQENIEWFIENQEFLMHTATRAAPYLYFIHQQVKKRKLPIELVLVPIIESGYNPFNLSSAGAAGIWQMMPDTASGFGVKQDWWYDGRRDIVASTHAALDYLTYLFNFFDGNSLLALAAYNTGEGSVMSAIRRNIREGKSTDFWSLPLPRETRIYVPRLLALATIITHPEYYHIYLPPVPNAPYLAQVDVGGQINLKQAAGFAGMSLKQLQHLNPGFNRLVTNPHGPHKLVLPIENVERFMVRLAHSPLSHHINWIQYKVKSTDTLESLAKRFNTTAFALREINHLKRIPLKKGMQLVIPHERTLVNNVQHRSIHSAEETAATKTSSSIISSQTANTHEETYTQSAIQPSDTLYMVRKDDTVEKIAKRFKLTPSIIYSANKLHPHSIIHPGDKLLLPTHLALPKAKIAPELKKISPGDTLYMVRQGDTLEKIAEKFHTIPAAIRVANLMTTSQVHEGDQIVVPSHQNPAPANLS